MSEYPLVKEIPQRSSLVEHLSENNINFISILLMEHDDIISFIAPPRFMRSYLEKDLFYQDKTLSAPLNLSGTYEIERFLSQKNPLYKLYKNDLMLKSCTALFLPMKSFKLISVLGSTKKVDIPMLLFRKKEIIEEIVSEALNRKENVTEDQLLEEPLE